MPVRPRSYRIVLVTVVAAAAVALCAAAIAASDTARHAMSDYLRMQVLASLRGQRETNADPLGAFRHLGLGIAARMLLICAVCWVVARPRSAAPLSRTPAWFLLAIALCASLPIAASPKMVGHYFLPSVPFFALGIASLALPPVVAIVGRAGAITRTVLIALAAGLVVASVAVPALGHAVEPRDVDMIQNLDAIAPAIPRGVTIGTCEQASSNWGLHSYVSRFFRVSLDARGAPVNGWFLVLDAECSPTPTCSPAASGTRLALYTCR